MMDEGLRLLMTRRSVRKYTDEPVSDEVASEVRKNFPRQTLSSIIARDGAFVEASSFGKTIYEYNIHSPGAWDYLSLTKEVLDHVRGQVGPQTV